MIYYFSGTGNSREVALRIAHDIQEEAISITTIQETEVHDKDTVGLVFPVYAWGIPRVMETFIRKLSRNQRPSYLFMVCTCGDDIGLTDKEVRRILQENKWQLDAAWSVTMPNTYIALPGFDVDKESLTRKKLEAALPRITLIAQAVAQRQRGITDVHPGTFAQLKSYVLRPLFNKILTGDDKFTVNADCIHCGKCAHDCPMQNITYDSNGLPLWKGNCADCLCCYHTCPVHAINFGPFTRNKGQYLLKKYLQRFQ